MVEGIKRVLVVGGGAQSRLCKAILEEQGYEFPIVFDHSAVEKPWQCELFHDVGRLAEVAKDCSHFIVGIGGHLGADRKTYAEQLLTFGLTPLSAIHTSSCIGKTVEVGLGLQAMMRSVVSEFSRVGNWCLLNTSCSIDHECVIGDGVHIMPGAVLAGCVIIGDCSTVGTNATILPRIKVGRGCMIGAGAVVTEDVSDGTTVAGNPARPLSGNAGCLGP